MPAVMSVFANRPQPFPGVGRADTSALLRRWMSRLRHLASGSALYPQFHLVHSMLDARLWHDSPHPVSPRDAHVHRSSPSPSFPRLYAEASRGLSHRHCDREIRANLGGCRASSSVCLARTEESSVAQPSVITTGAAAAGVGAEVETAAAAAAEVAAAELEPLELPRAIDEDAAAVEEPLDCFDFFEASAAAAAASVAAASAAAALRFAANFAMRVSSATSSGDRKNCFSVSSNGFSRIAVSIVAVVPTAGAAVVLAAAGSASAVDTAAAPASVAERALLLLLLLFLLLLFLSLLHAADEDCSSAAPASTVSAKSLGSIDIDDEITVDNMGD